eukprot:TRINITY_DN15514_c0_g1_i1.p1 TRINITY_DN15514_c0_g1~~TRINITY_DN15514_c0_g1_i1.p1  ORF type:complete len:184 (+),score=11.53 TRINITY_DN15514_c0_g1_i1:3-554(+)
MTEPRKRSSSTYSRPWCPSEPPRFDWVPKRDRKDFYEYFMHQFNFWKKEKRRLAYKIRRSILNKSTSPKMGPGSVVIQNKDYLGEVETLDTRAKTNPSWSGDKDQSSSNSSFRPPKSVICQPFTSLTPQPTQAVLESEVPTNSDQIVYSGVPVKKRKVSLSSPSKLASPVSNTKPLLSEIVWL